MSLSLYSQRVNTHFVIFIAHAPVRFTFGLDIWALLTPSGLKLEGQ